MTTQFKKVSPEDIDNSRVGPRGRVSYPILKGFMETGHFIAEIIDSERKPANLNVLLKSYITTHQLPIKIFMRAGHLYAMRLDIDKDGNKIENWEQSLVDNTSEVTDGPPITPDEIAKKG